MSAWQKRRKQRRQRKREEKRNSTCLICYDAIVGKKGRLNCNHTFCLGCAEQWSNLNKKCAVCRAEVPHITNVEDGVVVGAKEGPFVAPPQQHLCPRCAEEIEIGTTCELCSRKFHGECETVARRGPWRCCTDCSIHVVMPAQGAPDDVIIVE